MQNINLHRDNITQGILTYNSRNASKTFIDITDVRMNRVQEVVQLISDGSNIKSIPYKNIKDLSRSELNLIFQSQALYTFPTTELIDWLSDQIDEYTEGYEPAIEICAGTGWIGRELEIPCTDNKMQELPEVLAAYQAQNVVPIHYPDWVEKLTAVEAIKKYHPEYVIASFATHKYGEGTKKSGNAYGVDTRWVIQNCHKYILIGNDAIHKDDPLMKRKHEEYQFPWLITRGNSMLSKIYVWENKCW